MDEREFQIGVDTLADFIMNYICLEESRGKLLSAYTIQTALESYMRATALESYMRTKEC